MMAKVGSIFVTGANRGIGFHLVKQMLVQFKPEIIFATYRSPDNSKELQELAAANSSLQLIQADVTRQNFIADVTDVVDAWTKGKGLNLLINNAGISSKYTLLEDLSVEELELNMLCNFAAPVLLTKALLPQLIKASDNCKSLPVGIRRAAVVNMSSILGSITGNDQPGMYPYRCSKAALNAATKAMSAEFKMSKILAVALHPGWVQTDMGGPKAPLKIDESIAGIINVLENLNHTSQGLFLTYDGKKLPW